MAKKVSVSNGMDFWTCFELQAMWFSPPRVKKNQQLLELVI